MRGALLAPHLCSFVGIRRHYVLAAALGLGVVLLAALDDTGALELLLALLGGDADQDDAHDDEDDANDDSDEPSGRVIVAVDFLAVLVAPAPY